jgi:general secretion pathway protein L
MGVKSLGVDIGNSRITGVVLEQQRKKLSLVASCSVIVPEGTEPAAQIDLLCQRLGWGEGASGCGLPLSMLSVRNLTVPFKDVKKIAQILPFELEEQLLAPIDSLVTDFSVGKTTDGGAQVVAFSLEKAALHDLLAAMQDCLDPDIVTPAMVPLVAQTIRHGKGQQGTVLIHLDQHSGSLALILNGKAVFYRRLPYPEQMTLHPPFHFAENEVVIIDQAAAEECIHRFSRTIKRCLEYFRMEFKVEGHPEQVVLTGPLAEIASIADIIHAALGLPVETMDLLAVNSISCPTAMRLQWQGQHFDRALSLALQGLRRPEINFRKDGFVKKRAFFSSKKRLVGTLSAAAVAVVCLLGFLGYDYHRLQQRDRALGEEMTAIYKKTFPGVTKVQDPFVEMRARLKSAQGPHAPGLLQFGNKRVLGLLADISTRIPAHVALRVNRLAIDRESVLIKGTTDTFNSVETIKSSLAASSKFKSVQIVSATADQESKNGTIRFEVQLQLEGI